MENPRLWRIASLVLACLVLAMAYVIYSLVNEPSEGTVAPSPLPPLPARQVDQTPGASEDEHRVTLAPGWPDHELPDKNLPLDLAHDYTFERDWHTRHAGYWSQALERFRGKPNVQYLEIGLFEGASFFWILENILTHESAHATGIDPFFREYSKIKQYEDTFFENLDLSGLKGKTTIIKGFSQVELRRLPLHSFDIIYIDGSHEARDVLEDAILSWRLLKPKGVLIFDDYGLWHDRPPARRPQFAIDVFYTFYRGEFTVTHHGYQVILTRRSN